MLPRYLGSGHCDKCTGEYRISIWLLDGSRLCAFHYHHVTGTEPPPPLALEDLPVPAADPDWTKLLPGLRMRPAVIGPGIELQAVHNVQLEGGTRTVSDGPAWVLNDANLVELVLMASAHRNDTEPDKLMVRSALLRILHGTERP